jgi:hypothetical protein
MRNAGRLCVLMNIDLAMISIKQPTRYEYTTC